MKENDKLFDNKPWINFYDFGVPKTIYYPNLMLWELVDKAVKKYPRYLAYEYYGTSATFEEFMFEIEEAARGLKAIGVKEGDVVSICSPNIPQAIIVFYAINMVGAIANMIHPLSALKEIEEYLVMSKSKYIFSIDISLNKILDIYDIINPSKVIVMSASDKMNIFVKFAYRVTQGRKIKIPDKEKTIVSWLDFLDFGKEYSGEFKCKRDTNCEAVILYSGGTTGLPKGIVLSNKNFNAVTMQTSSMISSAKPGDSILTIMPIFHAFGLDVSIHTPLCLGIKCILIPIFNYKKFGSLIKQYKPNYIVGIPTLLDTMINDKKLSGKDLSFVKDIITGGDVVSIDLKKKVDTFMKSHGSLATVRPGYGLTEGSGASCLLPINVQPEGSIGVPLQDMLYKIVDIDTGYTLPANMEGEICISGPNVMMRYLNNTLETDKVLIKDEKGRVWLRTGDVGKMDEDGFVYFVQRLKRIIVSSGYNIYPSHIENIIKGNPNVQDVCVVSKEHPYKGHVAKAFIVLKNGVKASDDVKKNIKRYCEEHLAKFTLPYDYEFREELPKTLIGKVDYKALEIEEDIKSKSP